MLVLCSSFDSETIKKFIGHLDDTFIVTKLTRCDIKG